MNSSEPDKADKNVSKKVITKENVSDLIMKSISKNKKSFRNKVEMLPMLNNTFKSFYSEKEDKMNFLIERIANVEKGLLEIIKEDEFVNYSMAIGDNFWTVGVLIPIIGETITKENTFLYNPKYNSKPIKLDLTELENYSAYGGQVVAVKCSSTKDQLKVSEMVNVPMLELFSGLKNNLNLLVAKGPFSDEQIDDFIDEDVNLIILFGPFRDDLMDFNSFVELCNNKLKRTTNLMIILVPSQLDHEFGPVYPQNSKNTNSSRVKCYNNPSMINVNGHIIALNNFDVIKDMSRGLIEKITKPNINFYKADRTERLCRHILLQKTFLPAFPASEQIFYSNDFSYKILPSIYITTSSCETFNRSVCTVEFINLNKKIYKINYVASTEKYHIE